MKRFFRVIGIAVLALVLIAGATAFFARSQDGPLVMFPGGELASGEWAEPSWQEASFLADVPQIEFQLLEPPRSRTTWVVVHEGHAYVPCAVPNFRLFKQWPHEAMRDGRAVVRVEGQRHRRMATRVTDPALAGTLGELVSGKYGAPSSDDPEAVWFFRLDPRAEG